MALKQQTLTLQGHPTLSSGVHNFYCNYVRELYRDGKIQKQKAWKETIHEIISDFRTD